MLILLSLLSCGVRQDSQPAPSTGSVPAGGAQGEPTPTAGAGLHLHMAEHLARLTEARDMLVQGRVEDARAALRWVADHPAAAQRSADAELPADGGGWLAAMQAAAAEGAASADPAVVARGVAQAANQCGGCHQALGLAVVLPHPGPAPAVGAGGTGDPGVAAHMAGHQWAADRMWAALVTPSTAAWAESLQVLSQPALDTLALQVGPEQADAVSISAWRVHELAADGLLDDNPDTRADLYGRILGACASCHMGQRVP